MNTKQRMSPLTVFFVMIMLTGALVITSVTAVVLYGMHIVDTKAMAVMDWVGDPVEGLPDLIDAVPELADALQYGLVPEYAENIEVQVGFVTSDNARRPSLAVTNHGSEAISYMAVRAAAIREDGVALKDWLLVVATPIAADRDCPGPLMPGATRHVVASHWDGLRTPDGLKIRGTAEVADIRIWDMDRLEEVIDSLAQNAKSGE